MLDWQKIDREVERVSQLAEYSEIELSDTLDVNFTLEKMEFIARNFSWQTADLAELLEGESLLETSENIWLFLRHYTEWLEEKGEQLRTPAMSLATGDADCDCTSILTSSLLLNMGIDHSFEVVAHLETHPNTYTHVFVSVGSEANQIYIDAVPEIEYFNAKEIQFYKQMSYPMSAKTVMLMGLSNEDTALKNMLEAQYMELEHFANKAKEGGTLSDEAAKELAILKVVITKVGTEDFEEALLLAIQNSNVASDAYSELYSDMVSEGLSGLGFLKKIRQTLDKIGDTGIGKAFRNVRDKAVRPAIRQLPGGAAIDKAASTAGKIVNAITADGPSQSQYDAQAVSYLPDSPSQQLLPQNVRREIRAPENGGGDNPATPAADEEKGFGDRFKSFMGKNKKWIIIAVVVLALAGLGYWVYKNRAEQKKKSLRGGRKRRKKQPTNAQILAALKGGKKRSRRRPARRKAKRYKINVRKSAPRRRKQTRRKKVA